MVNNQKTKKKIKNLKKKKKKKDSLESRKKIKEKKLQKVFEFQKRKKEHIRVSLNPESQSTTSTGLDLIEFHHEALPEMDFEEVNLETDFFGRKMASPLFISSMTAGHSQGRDLNSLLARVCQRKKWALGIGSQRLHLLNLSHAKAECKKLRKEAPDVFLMSNIGLTEAIQHPPQKILELAKDLKAAALILHTNPLQECFQEEGSPQFRGGIEALEKLIEASQGLPILLKETGCGFSRCTLERLQSLKLSALDISGLGGTHWGLVEGMRGKNEIKKKASKNFSSWGIRTLDSLMYALQVKPKYEVWASGGVRSGLDAAKLLGLGAKKVGLAQPIMKEALKGEKALCLFMDQLEFELKVALFCTGCKDIQSLRIKKPWVFRK